MYTVFLASFCRTNYTSLRHHSHKAKWNGSKGHMDGTDTEWSKGIPQLRGQCHEQMWTGILPKNLLHQCGGWGTDAPHRVLCHCAGPHCRRDQGGASQCTRWDGHWEDNAIFATCAHTCDIIHAKLASHTEGSFILALTWAALLTRA